MSAALELRGIDAGYGPFRSLFDVSLRLDPGEAVALVGPNGAGKTTVSRVASGLVVPTAGTVLVNGVDLTGRLPHRFVRAGVAHATEGRSVFSSLTVQENLTLSFRRSRGRRGVQSGLEDAYEMFPALAERSQQGAGTLSGGEQRMLSMARVLVEAPDVLIADELSLGLAPIAVEETYRSLARLREQGTALLIVEQMAGYALELCDRVATIEHGEITWEGPSEAGAERIRSQLHTAG